MLTLKFSNSNISILTPKMMCNKLFTIIDAIKEAAEKGEVLYL